MITARPPIDHRGKLSVRLRSESYLYSDIATFEVRDSHMRLVERGSGTGDFTLPSGLYEVSAVLEDGHRHKAYAKVTDGKTTPLELGLPHPRPQFAHSTERARQVLPPAATAILTGRSVATLMKVSGARLMSTLGESIWTFDCPDMPSGLPFARFRIGDQVREISLPTSHEGGYTANTCIVQVEDTSSGFHVQARFSPNRIVANALQNMLMSGHVIEAADAASRAVELLGSKYTDPTGAALGALILYKTGRLDKWRDWLENLARDFSWLPDGKILLANLINDAEPGSKDALDLALEVADRRPLFAESFSLLLKLLRESPENKEERRSAANSLADVSPRVDWNSFCLSFTPRSTDD